MKTKTKTHKKQILLVSSLLISIILLIFSSVMPNLALNSKNGGEIAKASSVGVIHNGPVVQQGLSVQQSKEQEPENGKEETISESEALRLKSNIDSIEQDLFSRDTDVLSELNRKIEQYEDMLASAVSKEETDKIESLIDTTYRLSLQYGHYKSGSDLNGLNARSPIIPVIPIIAQGLSHTAYVAAVISGFSCLGYDLSAELTTKALTDDFIDKEYKPVFSNKVLSSQTLFDIVDNTSIQGTDMFEKTDLFNTYQQDLYFGIRQFSYTKTYTKSRMVTITDTYDYHPQEDRPEDEDTGIQGFAYDLMYAAQKAGIIHPVKVKISVDAAKYPRLQIVNKVNNVWKIKVTNYRSYPMDLVYNSKMCDWQDAANWTGLSDIQTLRLEADSSEIVDIQENGTATDFAFSYIVNGKRLINYSHETYLADHNLNQDFSEVSIPYYTDIGIVGKNGGTWLINVTNNHTEKKELLYNAKMCFEGDAKTWTGLKDIHSEGYLNVGESRIIAIGENALAGNIAVKLVGETEEILIYASRLNKDCTMSVSRVINAVYNYLGLTNLGKSGSYWNIQIHNPNGRNFIVFYNKKMCFENDAKNWTNLKDVEDVAISAYGTTTVSVKTNFSATTVAFCYYDINDRRLISYANQLNKNGGIKVMNNYI